MVDFSYVLTVFCKQLSSCASLLLVTNSRKL